MRYKTASEIINQVALEVGLNPTSDPFSSPDPAYRQLIGLLNSGGLELLEEGGWAILRREEAFTTNSTTNPDGVYDLPADFQYMIDQTGWDRSNEVPLFGPQSPQQWAYLKGRNLVSSTIYASFRQMEGKLYLFPQPPPDGIDISYEYISSNWVGAAAAPGTYKDAVDNPADVVLYVPLLVQRLLKLRFLEARGFDTTKAEDAYLQTLESWKGKDKGAPILNAGNGGWEYPYLDGLRNTPDTNYGQP